MEIPEQRLTGPVDSDFSRLEGTNCYCSEESGCAIRQAISGLPLCAIHRIGTGDYHYISLFWAERIPEPFVLVLFDNHPDDQPDAFGEDILSCGSWVGKVRELPMCVGTIWYDGAGVRHISGNPNATSKAYLSIDLDILSAKYASTDWDQGDLSLDSLSSLILGVMEEYEVAGVDICGGLTPEKGASSADIALNAAAEEALVKLFV